MVFIIAEPALPTTLCSAVAETAYINLTAEESRRLRLLIVEDDHALAAALGEALRRRGITNDHADRLADATQMLDAAQYSAILLDFGLPDGDGVSLLRRLRANGNPVPILVTTARGEIDDRITGLDAGADDYLTKPYDVDELVARLRAVWRRQGNLAGARLEAGNIALDTLSGDLMIDDIHVILTVRERQLIELLLRRAGQVASKQLVEDQLFGLAEPVGSNAVEVYAHRLRRKLAAAHATARIETIRGVGYLLRVSP